MLVTYLIFLIVASALCLRYRVKVKGLDKIAAKGDKGILFLPNHPALIDPVIMNCVLFRAFHPRSLVDEKQVRQTVLKYLVKRFRLLVLPDMRIAGMAGMDEVKQQIDNCAEALKQGDNVLMYPAGRLYRSRLEKLRGNGGVARIIQKHPDVRIVMVRTTGLWGSSFSRSCGYQQPFQKILATHLKHLLANLFFFSPRREVSIEFTEIPEDFPKHGDKEEINRYLEQFYNVDAPRNTYVPYYWWEHGGARIIPEPETYNAPVDTKEVPEEVRQIVYAKLHELSPLKNLNDSNTLGTDLGLDSLMVAELQDWIQEQFHQQVSSPDALRTVGSVLLAAIGQSAAVEPLLPIPPKWFVKEDPTLLYVPEGAKKITDTFLENAVEKPNFVLIADQNSGCVTNRTAILAIMVLKDSIAAIPEERVGIMMPACVGAFIVYMATLFAGKTPVLVNWTVGSRNMDFCLKNAGVQHILTANLVVRSLEGRGTDFSAVKDMFIFLEDIKAKLSLGHKLACVAKSYLSWNSLRKAKVSDLAAILFTSGSESRPKTVPLTHENVIEDIKAAMAPMGLRRDDCMIGMLPPFHSFGLLLNFLMPAVANLRVVYHTNPTEGSMLARLIAAYHCTMMVGTPTFVGAILRNATAAQVQSVRIYITGAEKCPEATYRLMNEMCPNAYFLEGYGITECSAVVALNQPGASKAGTIGHIIGSLEWKILNEQGQEVPAGTTGMLYVAGKSVFPGYLNYDGPNPFTVMDGKNWYRTGDLVQADAEGYITFMGRLKRFVKVGGEMVSLPAIEEVLMNIYRSEKNPLPLAVEAKGSESRPELVLFSTIELDKDIVNQQIRAAGMSPIHYIHHIVNLKEIPLLGSGKTDYQSLKKMA